MDLAKLIGTKVLVDCSHAKQALKLILNPFLMDERHCRRARWDQIYHGGPDSKMNTTKRFDERLDVTSTGNVSMS